MVMYFSIWVLNKYARHALTLICSLTATDEQNLELMNDEMKPSWSWFTQKWLLTNRYNLTEVRQTRGYFRISFFHIV